MNNIFSTTYDIDRGSGNFTIGDGILNYDRFACQVVLTGLTGGVDATFTIQESNDGVNWSNIVDNSANPLTVTFDADGTFMLKSTVFLGRFIRAAFVNNAATDGLLTITTFFKNRY